MNDPLIRPGFFGLSRRRARNICNLAKTGIFLGMLIYLGLNGLNAAGYLEIPKPVLKSVGYYAVCFIIFCGVVLKLSLWWLSGEKCPACGGAFSSAGSGYQSRHDSHTDRCLNCGKHEDSI